MIAAIIEESPPETHNIKILENADWAPFVRTGILQTAEQAAPSRASDKLQLRLIFKKVINFEKGV